MMDNISNAQKRVLLETKVVSVSIKMTKGFFFSLYTSGICDTCVKRESSPCFLAKVNDVTWNLIEHERIKELQLLAG